MSANSFPVPRNLSPRVDEYALSKIQQKGLPSGKRRNPGVDESELKGATIQSPSNSIVEKLSVHDVLSCESRALTTRKDSVYKHELKDSKTRHPR